TRDERIFNLELSAQNNSSYSFYYVFILLHCDKHLSQNKKSSHLKPYAVTGLTTFFISMY
ncbi:hypothetical protein, partial [Paraglaciecola sp.]|uniref:hypothetical protein n=1 Tax=Paraglaciecola sp. TaxID=1920173 RepID=UPI0030F3919D